MRALLEQMLTGDLRRGEPAYLAAVARYPELPMRFDALKALEEHMQGAADEEQSLLEEALGMEPLPGEDRFAGLLKSELQQAAGPSSLRAPMWRRLGLPLGLAAAMLAMLLLIRGSGDDRRPQDPQLPAPSVLGSASGQTPSGGVSAYTLFRWDLERPADGSFTLEIYSADAPDEPLIVVDHLERNQWTYAQGGEPSLPGRIVWRVFAMQAGIPTGARAQGEAWLEPGD